MANTTGLAAASQLPRPDGWRLGARLRFAALGRTRTVTTGHGRQEAMTDEAAGQRLKWSTRGGSAGQSGGTTGDHDPLGRVASEQRADGTGAVQTTVTYSYDATGNKTQETTTYAGGAVTSLASTYDPLDRLATQSDGTRSYTYDANGNATQQRVLNGSSTAVETDATYDGANRVASQHEYGGPGMSPLGSDVYTYDQDGNRTQVVENTVATSYAYDGAHQLTQVKDGTGLVTASYAYDANHNRTSQTTSAGTTSYSYDAASDTELTSLTNPSGKVTSYVYDTNGNLTRAVYDASGANQVTTYGYDSSNRLTSVTKPDGTVVAFTYDADGNRNSKAVTSGGTTTVNDLYQLGHLAEQTDGTGTMLARFSYDSQGVPTSVQVGSDPATAPRYYYVYNGHGDVAALTDATGTAVASYGYDAWRAGACPSSPLSDTRLNHPCPRMRARTAV